MLPDVYVLEVLIPSVFGVVLISSAMTWGAFKMRELMIRDSEANKD